MVPGRNTSSSAAIELRFPELNTVYSKGGHNSDVVDTDDLGTVFCCPEFGALENIPNIFIFIKVLFFFSFYNKENVRISSISSTGSKCSYSSWRRRML
jgi:hypothetical protein